MGRNYKEAIENYLKIGGNAHADIRTEGGLNEFWGYVSLLEELARESEA